MLGRLLRSIVERKRVSVESLNSLLLNVTVLGLLMLLLLLVLLSVVLLLLLNRLLLSVAAYRSHQKRVSSRSTEKTQESDWIQSSHQEGIGSSGRKLTFGKIVGVVVAVVDEHRHCPHPYLQTSSNFQTGLPIPVVEQLEA